MIKILFLFFAVALNASPLKYGSFTAHDRQTKSVIAAPHGGYDFYSDTIALEVAKQLEWSVVTADGFRSDERPINVNRPTEGVGLASANERHTKRAATVYEAYRRCVLHLQKSPELYVEIHGQGRFPHMEVAVVGLTTAESKMVKSILSKAFGRNVEMAVEGVDGVFYAAAGAKKFGLLGEMRKALHIELDWLQRRDQRDETVRALVKALPLIEKALTPKL